MIRACWRRLHGITRISAGGEGRKPPQAVGRACLVSLYKILYIVLVSDLKPVRFRGSALDDLRAFPVQARREAGHQIDQVQRGRDPDDWKPMNMVGPGVREIRVRDADGTFRVIYLARFADAVHVLHCFRKKTRKTRKADIDLAARRYRDLARELGE